MTKVHKIWMYDYWNENRPNDIFHFSVSVVELKFQQISFLSFHFYVPFIRKLTLVLILTLVFRILDDLTEKQCKMFHCAIFHYKNKNIYNFYTFTIKTGFRNKSWYRRFRWKNRAKPSQSADFAPFFFFFFKKPLHWLKNEAL